jgi:single-stranded DNA-binding protein
MYSRTEWHRVQTGTSFSEYAAAFKKGSHFCVEGELRGREYENNGANADQHFRAGQCNAATISEEAAA